MDIGCLYAGMLVYKKYADFQGEKISAEDEATFLDICAVLEHELPLHVTADMDNRTSAMFPDPKIMKQIQKEILKEFKKFKDSH